MVRRKGPHVKSAYRSPPPAPEAYGSSCGKADMISEIYDILQDQGVEPDRIHADVYF